MISQINLNATLPAINKRPIVQNRPSLSFNGQASSKETPAFAGGIGNFVTSPILSMSVLSKIDNPALKQAYVEVHKAANPQGKADLKFLLDTGKLLSADADDATSTLHNLQKIIREPRAQGLNSNDILNSALRALANPYTITQNFGQLSAEVSNSIIQNPQYSKISNIVGLNTSVPVSFMANKPIADQQQVQPQSNLPPEYNVDASGTCVAASMEFNLADKRPAEYARYAAELSSPNLSVLEDFNFSDIDKDTVSAMYWLDQFKVEYQAEDFMSGKIVLKPDQAAIFRAISQTKGRASGTRSSLNVLMQSTFMHLGSAKSYNSLNDVRTGGFNQSDRGLTEFEKNFAEAIIDDNGGKTSVTYQIVDDNAYLVGYNKNYSATLMDIVNSLKAGFNVIAGITEIDANAKIIGGHEITIVASKVGQDGKLYFVCNDTDDDVDVPIEISADELIPKVHHAGIPNVILDPNNQAVGQKPLVIQIPPQIKQVLNTAVAQQNLPVVNNNQVNKAVMNLVA